MIILDTSNYELKIDNKTYKLTDLTYRFLFLLSNNKVCTREEIAKSIYDIDVKEYKEYKDTSLNSCINKNISKLRSYGLNIKTRVGIGYRLISDIYVR